ncbi:MAG: matrixin family metalloprotease, partial [Actinomycetota bacterium]
CTDETGKIVRDADLALNVTQHWEDIGAEPDSRHSFDIRSIVTHELGHVLSLLDLYDADSLHQTMMGNAEYGETRKRTLALGDIIGLQTAYPCGKGDTCRREGIAND